MGCTPVLFMGLFFIVLGIFCLGMGRSIMSKNENHTIYSGRERGIKQLRYSSGKSLVASAIFSLVLGVPLTLFSIAKFITGGSCGVS